jgi:hypothetical protein
MGVAVAMAVTVAMWWVGEGERWRSLGGMIGAGHDDGSSARNGGERGWVGTHGGGEIEGTGCAAADDDGGMAGRDAGRGL